MQNSTAAANLIGLGCTPLWGLALTAKTRRPKTSRRTRDVCAAPTPSSSGPACSRTRSVCGRVRRAHSRWSVDSRTRSGWIRHLLQRELSSRPQDAEATVGRTFSVTSRSAPGKRRGRFLDVDLEVTPLHPRHDDPWKPGSAAPGLALPPNHVPAPGQLCWIGPREQTCERVKAHRIEGLSHP